MQNIDLLIAYFSRSSVITIFVLSWLSIYFILTFVVLFSRYIGLSIWISREKEALRGFMIGLKKSRGKSFINKYNVKANDFSHLKIFQLDIEKISTSGLSILSGISSTSPFIGLFGTVVSILDTFSKLNTGSTLGVIAPAISEALVATGAGIFVAIPAYSAHIFLKRKAYELNNIIAQQVVALSDKQNVGL